MCGIEASRPDPRALLFACMHHTRPENKWPLKGVRSRTFETGRKRFGLRAIHSMLGKDHSTIKRLGPSSVGVTLIAYSVVFVLLFVTSCSMPDRVCLFSLCRFRSTATRCSPLWRCLKSTSRLGNIQRSHHRRLKWMLKICGRSETSVTIPP